MSSATRKLKFKTDFEKSVIIDNFQARGWTRSIYLFISATVTQLVYSFTDAAKRKKMIGTYIGLQFGMYAIFLIQKQVNITDMIPPLLPSYIASYLVFMTFYLNETFHSSLSSF